MIICLRTEGSNGSLFRTWWFQWLSDTELKGKMVKYLGGERKELNTMKKFISAGTAGIAGRIAAQPFEYLKNGIHANSLQKVSVFNNFQILFGLKRLLFTYKLKRVMSSVISNSPHAFIITGLLFFVWELCQNNIRFV